MDLGCIVLRWTWIVLCRDGVGLYCVEMSWTVLCRDGLGLYCVKMDLDCIV